MSQINGSHNGSTVPQNGQVTSGPQGWDTLQYDSSSAPHDPEEQVTTYIAFPQPPQDHGINDATRLRFYWRTRTPYLSTQPVQKQRIKSKDFCLRQVIYIKENLRRATYALVRR